MMEGTTEDSPDLEKVGTEDSLDMEKVVTEDSPNLENVGIEKKVDSSDETTPKEGQKKGLALKLQKLKMRGLGMQRSYTPSSINMAAVYELRLKKLRKNNRNLARALADQKIETQQWYSENISLKGQLQELNECLLRQVDKNSEKIIEQEVERRFKEIGEPLNAAISQAMENLLVVVENFSKVKQLANVRNNFSRSSSSSFSFPRTSGSRAPLSLGSNTSSPCQSVRPMVSGHVLQPAMVSIQKLDDMWKTRVKERFQEREDEMNMSTINENSVHSVVDEAELSSHSDSVNTSQLSMEEQSSQSATESPSPISPSKRGLARKGRKSRENRSGGSESPIVQNSLLESSASPEGSKTGEENNPVPSSSRLEPVDDPLEGPSWLYTDSPRSRGRGRGRGRPRKRGNTRSSHGSQKPTLNLSIGASSESEDDESCRKKRKSGSNEGILDNGLTVSSNGSKQNLEHSYLDSPNSMLAKLEVLEAKAGRRSKSKSKGRSLKISEVLLDNVQNHQQCDGTILEKDEAVSKVDDKSLDSCEAPVENKSQSSSNPKIDEVSRTKETDFLIRDTDLTCIADMSMEITEPVTKFLAPNAPEIRKLESTGNANKNNERKFFRTETTLSEDLSKTGKTPFDLSLMDDTYVAIPPFSSQKNLEKENMPPESSKVDVEREEIEKDDLKLRRVSIVLKDCMKSSEPSDMIMLDGNILSPSSEREIKLDQMTSTSNERNSKNKKSLYFSMKSMLSPGEVEGDDEPWSPGKKRKSNTQKASKSYARKRSSKGSDSSVHKRQSKRKTQSELNPTIINQLCEVSEEDLNASVCGRDSESKSSETANTSLEHADDKDSVKHLSDCFVKICRTPLKEIYKTTTPLDETCTIQDEELPDFNVLWRKLSSKDTAPTVSESSCMNTNQIDATVECAVLGTSEKPCQELKTDQVESELPNLSLPDDDEVKCLETSSVKDEVVVISDPVIDKATNDIPDTHENTDDRIENTDVLDTEAPRKRRGAAMKIASFKEPNLNKKMRREREATTGTTNAPTRGRPSKSGRKSSIS